MYLFCCPAVPCPELSVLVLVHFLLFVIVDVLFVPIVDFRAMPWIMVLPLCASSQPYHRIAQHELVLYWDVVLRPGQGMVVC